MRQVGAAVPNPKASAGPKPSAPIRSCARSTGRGRGRGARLNSPRSLHVTPQPHPPPKPFPPYTGCPARRNAACGRVRTF